MKHENLYSTEGEAKAESKNNNSVTHLLRWLIDDQGDFFIIKTFEKGKKTHEALFDAFVSFCITDFLTFITLVFL